MTKKITCPICKENVEYEFIPKLNALSNNFSTL
jgi:hypothetical protein